MDYKGQYDTVPQYLRDLYADYLDQCEVDEIKPMDWTEWYEGTEDTQPKTNANYVWPVCGNPYY